MRQVLGTFPFVVVFDMRLTRFNWATPLAKMATSADVFPSAFPVTSGVNFGHDDVTIPHDVTTTAARRWGLPGGGTVLKGRNRGSVGQDAIGKTSSSPAGAG